MAKSTHYHAIIIVSGNYEQFNYCNNELVSGFILNTQGNLWRSVDNETRTRIMVLSYMDFKSWIKPYFTFVYSSTYILL